MNVKMKLAATALAFFPILAVAAPTLVFTPRLNGNELRISTEFLADSAQPVAAVVYEFSMDQKAPHYSKDTIKVGSCISSLPPGVSGLCNPATDKGAVRVVVYTTDLVNGLPSGTIGEIAVPASAVKLASDGTIELGHIEFAGTDAKLVTGETLVDVEPGLRMDQRSLKPQPNVNRK